jgi:hypothetical protein
MGSRRACVSVLAIYATNATRLDPTVHHFSEESALDCIRKSNEVPAEPAQGGLNDGDVPPAASMTAPGGPDAT